ARFSRLTAKVDSTAIQDGFQVYMHYFVVSDEGDWSVVQQGMQTETSKACRYHWNSSSISSFVEEPHTAICGENQGEILNLTDKKAGVTQKSMLDITRENPDKMMQEIRHLAMPAYKDIKSKDV